MHPLVYFILNNTCYNNNQYTNTDPLRVFYALLLIMLLHLIMLLC